MHDFQCFDLTLWQVLHSDLEPDRSLDDMITDLEKWHAATLGNLVREAKNKRLPADLAEELDKALTARNCLAHHFLRDYFLRVPDPTTQAQALADLATVKASLYSLEASLQEHLRAIGMPQIDDVDEETLAEIDLLRPSGWWGNE